MKRKLVQRMGLVIAGVVASLSVMGCEKASGDNVSDNTANLVNQVAEEEVPAIEGYELLWHDEFNGTALDESNWTKELRDPGWTNNELQAYTADEANIYVEDGMLHLHAVKTVNEDGSISYTSGKVNSQNKRDFLYGKVVARAKVPAGKGLWPAIWMMPQVEEKYGQWPKCGEIDIMEVLGDQTEVAYSTIHYGEPHGEQQGLLKLTDGTFATDFHEYSVEWEPGEIRYYIDENLVLTVNDWYTCVQGEEWKPYPAPFDQNFFVQMNLAVGGDWPGNPDETTDFENADFEIDYVRVYQKPEYDTNVERPAVVFRDPDENGNYVNNASFAEEEDLTDDVDWKFILLNGGDGEATIQDGAIVITSIKEGDKEYSVQLVQPDMPVRRGSTYRVSFEAKADEERQMITCVSAPNVGWIRYLADTSLDLTTEWQTYTYEFTISDNDDPSARLEFNMGAQGSTATIYITNVVFEELK